MEIYSIPGDGNCLFNGIAHQLHLRYPHSSLCTSSGLRAEIVEYICAHLEDYSPLILDSCGQIYGHELISNLTEKQLILRYLSDLKKDGFWGGAECLSAISNLRQLKINVYYTGTQNKVVFTPIIGGYVSEINLLYNGSHFDSLRLNREPTDFPSQSSGISISKINAQRKIHASSNLYTLVEETQREESPNLNLFHVPLCFGSWNVRGINKNLKRDILDTILLKNNILICGIQETNMIAGTCSTENYEWYLTSDPKSKRGGVGLLIRRHSQIKVNRIKKYCGCIITMIGKFENGEILFISVYVPPNTSQRNRQMSSRTFSTLLAIIDRCPLARDIVLLGDFNAHFDTKSLSPENENGVSLEFLSNSTLLFNHALHGRRRILFTWTNGCNQSQLDYILTREKNQTIYVKSVKTTQFYQEISDHRLIWIDCIDRNRSVACSARVHVEVGTVSAPRSYSYKSLNLTLLKNEEVCIQYKKILTECFERINPLTNLEGLWQRITTCLKTASQQVLTTKTPLTPKRRKALAQFKRAQYQNNIHPQNPSVRTNLKIARKSLNEAYSKHRADECQQFFRNLGDYKPSERLRLTYSYLRQYRRTQSPANRQYIPISSWYDVLRKSEGAWPPTIEETDYFPLGPPPTMEEIQLVIKHISSGTAPGPDEIPIELLKQAPEIIIAALHKVIETVWEKNEPPSEWLNTIQVPIPKIRNPKRIDDYRCISLCNVGYKIYAKLLLDRLDGFLDPLPSYQTAFLANRSTDDHMFVIRRVLDEEWRAGNRVFVLSIDLAKAFDTVDLNVVSECLQQHAPHWLVNRIIKTCFWEHTSIKWFNICSASVKKCRGVKQGCPISPRVFNYILNEVLVTVADSFPELELNQCGTLKLPLILAYADDVVLITRDLIGIEPILCELKVSLEAAGLKINPQKCISLIRDPVPAFSPTPRISLAGISFTTVTTMRYLGTYLTSGLSRPLTIRTRCRQALGVSKLMQEFIKRNKVPFETVIKMYHTTIVPMIIYGLKTTALTYANRQRLRKYELFFLKKLLEFSSNKPTNRIQKIKEILNGKTITKKIKVNRLNYWGHIHRRGSSHILSAASIYSGGPKKPGRPCFTWHDSLRQDLLYYNKTQEEWVSLLSSRVELRKAAEEIYTLEESDSSDVLEDVIAEESNS